MLSKIYELIDSYWRFDSYQKPVSSWHEKQDLLQEVNKLMKAETIICSANWLDDGVERKMLPTNIKTGLVICGHRHPHCKTSFMALLYPDWQTNKLQEIMKIAVNNKEVQGFLTSKNRFVDREEAAKIHVANGGKLNYSKKSLYSEDIY